MNAGQRKFRIERPYGLLDFLHEILRTGPGTANRNRDGAVQHLFLTFVAVHHNGPIHGGWRGLIDAIVMHVPDDADDLAPIVGVAHANSLAERISRIVPILP